MKRTSSGAALLGLALAIPVLLPAPSAAGADPASIRRTRVEGVLFARSQTIRTPGVLILDHAIHLNQGVTLTLIGDEVWRTSKARTDGPGTLVVMTNADADLAGAGRSASDNVTRVAAVGSEVRFVLAHPAPVALEVFDAQGRSVRRSDLGALTAGEHRVELGQRGLRTGVYLYRVASRAESRSGKVFIAR